jgi:hypothetical protein
VPYQLHCEAPQAEETLLDELETELFELEEGVLLGVELELTTELFELDDVVAVELEVAVVHTAPVTAGFSETLPFLSPCTPKLTDWPG